jgi:hypothetical protein
MKAMVTKYGGVAGLTFMPDVREASSSREIGRHRAASAI